MTEQIYEIPLEYIQPPKELIRDIDGATLNDLRESIKIHGVLQPILLRPTSENQFEIICGNHRYLAAKGAELKTIPARIKKVTATDALVLAITENVQRLSMDPLREGELYSKLPWDYKEITRRLGKSSTYIRHRIMLYKNLVPELKGKIGKTLTLSSAITLSKIQPRRQMSVYETIERTKKAIENEALPKHPSFGLGGYGTGSWASHCVCPECGSRHEKGRDYARCEMCKSGGNKAEMPKL